MGFITEHRELWCSQSPELCTTNYKLHIYVHVRIQTEAYAIIDAIEGYNSLTEMMVANVILFWLTS